MITTKGYSKDPGIVPQGVAVTLGRTMMQEQGGVKTFLANFISTMDDHENGSYWMHKCTNLPKQEPDIIYLIVLNRLWARVYCGGMHLYNPDQPEYGRTADGKDKLIDWNYIILSGPLEKCPYRSVLPGFRGFRYTTKLF